MLTYSQPNHYHSALPLSLPTAISFLHQPVTNTFKMIASMQRTGMQAAQTKAVKPIAPRVRATRRSTVRVAASAPVDAKPEVAKVCFSCQTAGLAVAVESATTITAYNSSWAVWAAWVHQQQ